MAGDWLKVEKDTPEKPEVYRIAEQLGISQAEAFLACFRVWCWADGQSEDGLVRVSATAIDTNARVPNFSQALREVGWLNLRTGSVELPNFVRHMGQSAKRRCLDTVRKMSARKADKKQTREEKRRVKKPPSPLPDIPEGLKTPEFQTAWDRWQKYRREKDGKPMTPSTIEAQLKDLAKWGLPAAVASIEQSIVKGWTGLFTPKGEFARGGSPDPGGETQEQRRSRLAAEAKAKKAKAEADRLRAQAESQQEPEIPF